MTPQHPALGIDYGEARIGIAATDPVGIMAHPVETIHRHKTDGVTRIVQLVQERGIRTLVLGIPVRMDGTEGTAAAKVRAFGKELAAALEALKKENPEVKLQLDVDKKAEFGVIVGIWDALTSVGIDAGDVPARIEINKSGAQ